MDDFLKHYNQNHDAYGRFSSASGARTRTAKRGLNKLDRLDRKSTKHFIKGYKNYYVARKPRQKYHQVRWSAGFPLSKLSTSKKASKYAKRLEMRVGTARVDGLNRRQVNAGRRYSLEFVE